MADVIDFKAAKRAKKAALRKPRKVVAPHVAPHVGMRFGWQVLIAPPSMSLAQMTRRDAVRQHASEAI